MMFEYKVSLKAGIKKSRCYENCYYTQISLYLYPGSRTGIAIPLTIVQVIPEKTVAFIRTINITSGGWIQIGIAVIYGAILSYKNAKTAKNVRNGELGHGYFFPLFSSTIIIRILVDPIFLMIESCIYRFPLLYLQDLYTGWKDYSCRYFPEHAVIIRSCLVQSALLFLMFDAWSAKGKTENSFFAIIDSYVTAYFY